jgi:hypothetical protein
MESKRNKKITIAVIAVCLALLIVCGVLCGYLLLKPTGTWVEIVQDETVLYTINLTESEDRTIVVEYEGRTNTIEIKEGKICVSQAECPDHTCVKMGTLNSNALPIVCLPNHLVVRFTDGK